ncbi:hypothetical protein U9M48_005371 [Paspalum notatum var. saurae]|uniref:Uncharacterized protein n=1 Tax=Paspalum notatum var. saurae TaxID=547442 RepID=A0AAQ3PVF9_PASNO
MGIPYFYKWAVKKYPSIVSAAKEEAEEGPDGIIYDNLYLDMNFIIHNCFHPKDQAYTHIHVCPPPMTLQEVFESMFEYMDRLFRVVRPRRLLYLAVDGVAPCAKMVRLQGGRFNNAMKARHEEIQEDKMRKELRAQGKDVPPLEISEVPDPNVITPGTEFMEKLSQALKYYIRARLNSDPGWKDIMVILSDANVPGEGEHKIMSFIRAQRSMEGYDPNTRHCLYGQDADLIMLALASHEVHFSILREDVLLPNQAKTKRNPKKPNLFLNICVLREYLEIDMKILDPVCKPDIERLIDDFIFICFLMGNDFIPHIPSLKTYEVYVCAYAFRVQLIFSSKFTRQSSIKWEGILSTQTKSNINMVCIWKFQGWKYFFMNCPCMKREFFAKDMNWNRHDSLQKACREELREASQSERLELKRELDDLYFNEERPHDRIRLGFPGWKSRFYREHFGVKTSNEIGKLQNDMVMLRSIWKDFVGCFSAILQKFHHGAGTTHSLMLLSYLISKVFLSLRYLSLWTNHCGHLISSWQFCHHEGTLFTTLNVAILSALPECYRKLMDREDFDYPQLKDEMNGKRFLWKGISEDLLLSATKVADEELTTQEVRRNTTRQDKIYRNSSSLQHIDVIAQTSYHSPQKLPLDSATSGIGGWISLDDDNDGFSDGSFRSPIKNLLDIPNDQAISAMFFNPEVVNPIPRLLDNVKVPDKTVSGADIQKRPLWHTYPGSRPPPPIAERPDTIWKPSTPMTPREEHKHAGMGWLGRGRGNTTAETQLINRSSGSYGHGAGKGTATETQLSSSGSYSYSYSHLVGMEKQNRGRSSRWAGAGHGVSAQSLGW